MKVIVGSPGGKYNLAKKIIQYLPIHKIYCEPFGGSGAVLLNKKPSEIEIFNDLDYERYFIMKFVRDMADEQYEKLKKKNWERDRQLWTKLKNSNPDDDVDKFYKFVYTINFSYGNKGKHYTEGNKKKYDVEKLLEIRNRLKNVKIYNMDYKKIVEKFDSKDTLFYFDPPYITEENDYSNIFKIVKFDPKEFVDILKNIKGKFIVSYDTLDYFKEIPNIYIKKIFATRSFNNPFYNTYEYLIFSFKPEITREYLQEDIDYLLTDLPEFIWIPNFVSISGSQVYGKHIPNDIDVIVKLPLPIFQSIMEHSPDIWQALQLKLNRIFKKPIHYVPSSIGGNWDNLGIYDLVLVPKEPELIDVDEPEFKEKYYCQELRAATVEIQNEAKSSKKEDKMVFGRFFFPEKTNLQAVMVLKDRGYEQAYNWIKENKPVIAQKKYDGNRLIVFADKKDSKVIFYSDDGRILPDNKLPETSKELLQLNYKINAIFDCECERWLNGKHLNREDVAGFLHNKTDFQDNGIVLNIFDILYLDDVDIHKKTTLERISILSRLGFPQSTIGIPNTKYHLNLAPSYIINNLIDIGTTFKTILTAPASEGIMLKKSTAPYSLKGYDNNWLKVKKYETVKVIVLKENPTKVPSVVNYDIGIRFDSSDLVDEKYIVELEGKKYLKVGKTFNIRKGLAKIGDIISILFHTANLYKNKDGKYRLALYEPIVEEVHPEELEPEKFKSVIDRIKLSGLLIEKFIGDLLSYNPKEVEDKVLIDDYRWLITWLVNDIKKYNKDLIKEKLKEVIAEIFNRGIATLHPLRYNKDIKDIVIEIIKDLSKSYREVNYIEPEIALKNKQFISKTDYNIEEMIKFVNDNRIYGIAKIVRKNTIEINNG